MMLPEPFLIERLRFASQGSLSASVMHEMRVEQYLDPMLNQLLLRLSTEVQAQRIAEGTVETSQDVTIDFPSSPFQHWKAKHALAWWLRWLVRWRPVRTEAHTRTVGLSATWLGYAKFPDSTIVLSDDRLGSPVYFLRSEHHTDVQ